MISIDGSQFLEVVMGQAVTTTAPTYHTSYAVTDLNGDFKDIDNTNGSLNGTTPVTVVAAPSGGDLRHDIKDVVIHNIDSMSKDFIIRIDDGGGKFIVFRANLISDGSLILENNSGKWCRYDANGGAL